MEGFQHLINGFIHSLTMVNLLACFIGALVGTIVGVLPGLGPTVTMALMLPFTLKYGPETGIWAYRFMKLCEKYKVDMVFTGHEHMFKKLSHGGVQYITSGGGGMPMQIPTSDGGYHHYLVVRVFGDY
ncbi:MAG: tripartite tricarboxylate transporter permease, partial [Deltaproteobacteria bacterium]